MRLLLDAHVSGKKIGKALRQKGHDVLAIDEGREFEGWSDESLMQLAASQHRILITFNVRDFPEIMRRWAEAQKRHSGCAILVGVDHSEYGQILKMLQAAFKIRPGPEDWTDLTFILGTDVLGTAPKRKR